MKPLPIAINCKLIAIGFGLGEVLRYQTKLEPADADWSAPSDQRLVNYPNLAPGAYRFLVRAVNAEGNVIPQPVAVEFRILPPLWRRWWFLALAAVLIGLAVYAAYRNHVARLVELERVRTRIATDLHDDISASLSRVAILSEVVKHQDGLNPQSARMLTEIVEAARNLVDSMSDIVWSIDPRRDDLQHLIARTRQFAADVLEAQGIQYEFHAPAEIGGIKLDPEQRRHLFLILKEALNNTAKHAQCTLVVLKLSVTRKEFRAELNDDGRGFAVTAVDEAATGSATRGGNGLKNMQRGQRDLAVSCRLIPRLAGARGSL